MEKISFSTSINATKDKVWKTLWDDSSYRAWTKVFADGSYAVTNWSEGSKILFLDGKGNGMVSEIESNKPNEYMSFRHLGEVKDGVEDTDSEAVKAWAGAHENYMLEEHDGVTKLAVELDMSDDFKDYFINTWPKALEQVKILSESGLNKA